MKQTSFVLKESCRLAGLTVVGLLLFGALVVTTGCDSNSGGGDSVSSSTPVVAEATPAPAATPTPAATPVPVTPDKAWEVWGTPKGVLHVAYSGEATYAQYESYYTAIDNYTPIDVKIHDIKRGDEQTRVFSGTCIQVDVEQVNVKPVGHVFFDKQGNPFDYHKNPEKLAECRRGTPTPNPSPSPSPSPSPTPPPRTLSCQEWLAIPGNVAPVVTITGTPTLDNDGSERGFEAAGTVAPAGGTFSNPLPFKTSTPGATISTTYTATQGYGPVIEGDEGTRFLCTAEGSKEFSFTFPEAPQCVDSPAAAISGPSFPTYTPAVPAAFFYYWDMNNGQGNTPKQNACEGRGGVWFGDEYNIPNDNSNTEYDDVCRTTVDGLSGQPGVDANFIKKVQTAAAVPASGGNPLSGSATFADSGSWEIRLLAASSVSEYNSNDPDYVKATNSAQLSCNGAATKSVSFNWIGHDSEYWWIEVRRNGSFYSKSAYVTNPSN